MSDLEFIMTVESDLDSLTIEEYAEGCAALLATGMVWQLQGSWQRAVLGLYDAGIIDGEGNVLQLPELV